MIRLFFLFLLMCSWVSCETTDDSKKNSEESVNGTKELNSAGWLFERVEGSKLVFQNGNAVETKLFDLKYVGQLEVADKAPYLIFSGRYCSNCDAIISIYVYSPSDKQLQVERGQNRYQYPGVVRDYHTDRIRYSSRAFYGQVMENTNGIVWYESRIMENGENGDFVYLVNLKNGELKDTIYPYNGEMDQTMALLKKGVCKEIPGRHYTSEP